MNPAAATYGFVLLLSYVSDRRFFRLGPLFLGLMFNLILLGMAFVQYYMYFIKYQRRDHLWIRIFASRFLLPWPNVSLFWKQVYTLLLVNVAGSVLYMIDMYIGLILNFGEHIHAIMAGGVQLFFAWRVKVLTSSWISTTSVCVTALLAVAGGIATAAEANAQEAVTDFQKFKVTVIIWLVSSCICDFLITGALVWYLLPQRGHKTGFEQSDELMDRIIRLTIQTGFITSFCAMMDLITFLAIASPSVHIIFTGMLGKLYTNALMSSLNARSGWSYSMSSKTNLDSSRKKDDVVRLTANTTEVFVQVERHEMTPMGTQKVSESEDWEGKQGDMV
ncbi:uncharacterized protein BT62DRAFT_912075 [Guyanagaster necrorhizus]|uniref:DUF6534 domain-containing protein n=1 Tax=Guyanagaster necrorhizus TaxID=856835 RepID=A0A9P7VFS0_9AGAR|nr:uncharacterized protein BT62DRAFT_912075 [Guyanagaster necrorhizus MCA 3950]KAG7439899.1 hypothetical protein BT62DRAFT_912075 [Guyanagaster necrorhizus MCA 3950]